MSWTEDDLIDFTPELRAMALEILKDYEFGPIFTPPVLKGEDGKLGALMLPSAAGGANWRGAAHDPETQVLYVPSMTWLLGLSVSMEAASRSQFDFGIDFSDAADVDLLIGVHQDAVGQLELARLGVAWCAP